jgi:hypothetical protein
MAEQQEFAQVFEALKGILQTFEPALVLTTDEPGQYYLNTHHIMKNKHPLFFGAVKVNKNYVSFHLMPMYACPELLADLSPALRARMQGKACFNFRGTDPDLFAELARLTQAGFEKFTDKSQLAKWA